MRLRQPITNRGIRVLYAEDDLADADLTRQFFSSYAPDIELEVVHTAAQCLERLSLSTFDALLLDQHLPDKEGIEVVRSLVQSGAALPIILVTGGGDEELVVMALRLGVADYAAKRGSYFQALPDIIRRAVKNFRSMQSWERTAAAPPRKILYAQGYMAEVDPTVQHFAANAPHLEITSAYTVDDALYEINRNPNYDLILSDLRLNDGSALDLFQALRNAGVTLPVIITTGFGDEQTAAAALRLGVCDYVVKRDGYLSHLPYSIENAIIRFRLQQEISLRRKVEEIQQDFVKHVMLAVTDGKLTLCWDSSELPKKLPDKIGDIALKQVKQLSAARHLVEEAIQGLGFSSGRAVDTITAAHEAAMNAVVHAGGGRLTMYSRGGEVVQIWVRDYGGGISVEKLPFATLMRGYTTAGTMGHGFKMIPQICDRMWLLTNPTGTTVVIEMDKTPPPEEIWLLEAI